MGALLDLAGLYKGKGLLPEAREVLERALAAAPDDAGVREALATVVTDLGTAAKGAGRLEEAETLYTAALEAWPCLAAAHYNLVRPRARWTGGTLWQRRRPARAAAAAAAWCVLRHAGARARTHGGLTAHAWQWAPSRALTSPSPPPRASSRARRAAPAGPRRSSATRARWSATRPMHR